MQNFFENLSRCYLIAEIGVNHNGQVSLAKEMIIAAKEAGADAVKFQTFSAKLLVSPKTPKVYYQEKNTLSSSESHLEMLSRLELSKDQHIELAEYCRKIEIEFLSTPYDVESAKFLDSLGVRIFKTASADLVDLTLHQYIASTGKPTIVSTGMGNLGEIERVVNIYDAEKNRNLILLHCVSNYPCADESLNMRSMNTLGKAFDLPFGYSDHSTGILSSVIAVARNAKVIEKHFTLNQKMHGPDHAASSSPSEFAELVFNVRRTEKMLGIRRKSRQIEEQQMAAISRKSIVLANSKQAGKKLTLNDFRLQRPGDGLDPGVIDALVGMVLRKDCAEGYQLKWSDIEDPN